MEIGEWALAIACWVLLGIILFCKAITWEIRGRKGIGIFLRLFAAVGGIALSVLLIMITDLRKPVDEPWSNLQKIGSHKTASQQKAHVPEPVEPVAIYMACQFDHYPITIPAGTSIHLLRIYPDFLKEIPGFPTTGIFHDVTAGDKGMTWPSISDGSWPSKREISDNIKHGKFTAPFIFKCDLSSLGKTTVEDVSIPILVRPAKNNPKGLVYQIAFDPLPAGTHFVFYVVNYCEDEVVVNWPDNLYVHVLGEESRRKVPLKMIKRDWPSNLMLFYPPGFKWSVAQNCNWM
jgi:hypothetical protein